MRMSTPKHSQSCRQSRSRLVQKFPRAMCQTIHAPRCYAMGNSLARCLPLVDRASLLPTRMLPLRGHHDRHIPIPLQWEDACLPISHRRKHLDRPPEQQGDFPFPLCRFPVHEAGANSLPLPISTTAANLANRRAQVFLEIRCNLGSQLQHFEMLLGLQRDVSRRL